jgi:hypothetical protein
MRRAERYHCHTSTVDLATHRPDRAEKESSLMNTKPTTPESQPTEVHSPRSGLTATVRVIRRPPIDGYPFSGVPFVAMELSYPEFGDLEPEEFAVPFDAGCALTLGRMLIGAGREASLGTGNVPPAGEVPEPY